MCRPQDTDCVADLPKCSSATLLVSAYIPPHLGCTKNVVRGVDSKLSPLGELSMARVMAIYRHDRVVDNARVSSKSLATNL